VTQRVREQKGPFAFPEITVDFLAIARNIPVEVQDVVGDLEGQPEQVAEAIEAIEFLIVAVGDECADPHGVNEAVPSGLLEHETQIVIRPDREIVVAHPAELHGLPLQGLDEQVVDFVENAQCRRRSDPLAALAKQAHAERVHGVAGVDRNGHPGAAMHRGHAAPRVAAVFDVVVHQKGVVQHF